MIRTNAYKLTAADFVELHLALTRRMRFGFRVAGILAALIGMGMTAHALMSDDPEPVLQYGALTMLLGLLGVTGSFRFFKTIRLRPESRIFEKRQAEWTFEADDELVRIVTEGTTVTHDWSAFAAWGELDGLILFWRQKAEHMLVPKRAFRDAQEIDQIKALASARLPSLKL